MTGLRRGCFRWRRGGRRVSVARVVAWGVGELMAVPPPEPPNTPVPQAIPPAVASTTSAAPRGRMRLRPEVSLCHPSPRAPGSIGGRLLPLPPAPAAAAPVTTGGGGAIPGGSAVGGAGE